MKRAVYLESEQWAAVMAAIANTRSAFRNLSDSPHSLSCKHRAELIEAEKKLQTIAADIAEQLGVKS